MSKKNKLCPDCGKMIWNKSVRCKSCAKRGSLNTFYGKKHSTETIESMSGENHQNWKGDKAKYKAIHIWVNSYKGRAEICEYCGKSVNETRIEWANIDHKYRRKLEEYISLCCKCHLDYDKLNGIKQYIPKQDTATGKFIS